MQKKYIAVFMQWLYNIHWINGQQSRGQNLGLMLSGEVPVAVWSHAYFSKALWMLLSISCQVVQCTLSFAEGNCFMAKQLLVKFLYLKGIYGIAALQLTNGVWSSVSCIMGQHLKLWPTGCQPSCVFLTWWHFLTHDGSFLKTSFLVVW